MFERLRLARCAAGSYIGPMAEKFDIYDGDPWSEMDIEDLTVALSSAIEDAATHLCRSGTVDDVRRNAEEIQLMKPKSVQ
jgi:hypothetical protein